MRHPFYLINTLLALSVFSFANHDEDKSDSYYDFVFVDEEEIDDLFDNSAITSQNDSDNASPTQGGLPAPALKSDANSSPINVQQMPKDSPTQGGPPAPALKSDTNSSPTNVQQMQGEPLQPSRFTAGYNAPAVIDVNHKNMPMSSESVRVFIDGAFTYWYATEEGLDLATSGALNEGTIYYAQNAKPLTQSSSYKPGFKVALGLVGDHEWSAKVAYTWYRGTNHTRSTLSGTTLTAGTSASIAPTGANIWAIDDWFLQGTGNRQALSGSTVSSSWHLGMDIGDAVVSRPFYTGTAVTVAPFAGLRTAWIRQRMTVNLGENPSLFSGTTSAQPIQSRNRSNSWSLGAIMGCESNWLLPMGLRFKGNASASLLYTQYTTIKHSEDPASSTFNQIPYTISMSNYNTVRPAAELGIGIGWGKYLSQGDFHLDFSADYNFMVFWSQNMFRQLIDHNLSGIGSTPGDLYLHGLTLTVRFDL